MKKITYLFALLMLASTLTAQPWHWINPTTGHHHINDISFVAPDLGIAVADNGVILHYNDNVWTQAESPVTVNLNAVYTLSPTLAWAVGNAGTILKYNGSEWVQQLSPTTGLLKDVCFTDETHGWAVGSSILFYDGNTWEVQSETGGLKTVSFKTPDEGWAGSTSTNLFHFINGEWAVDNTFANGNTLYFNEIVMTGPSTVRMTGNDLEGRGIFYENTGSGWQQQPSGNVNTGISFTDHQHGFGIENKGASINDSYPAIYRFTDGTWDLEYTANMWNTLTAIETVDETTAFVCDSIGFVYSGNDGNWEVSNGFTTDSILDINFTRANNGYFACGADGIWHYSAGTWANELKVEGYSFNKIVFSDDNYGWASAFKQVELPAPYNYEAKLYIYNSGVWTEQILPINPVLIQCWSPVTSINLVNADYTIFTSYNVVNIKNGTVWETYEVSAIDSISAVRLMASIPVDNQNNTMIDEWESAWMCTKHLEGSSKGIIYQNSLNGNTWDVSYETATGAFNDLCVADYMNIYAVGDNGLIAHFDGQSWTEFTPVTDEDLLSVYINDENQGWASGKNGVLLQYNGMAWSVVQSNTWNDLHKVCFYQDFGLIGGENGTLLSTEAEMPVGIANPGIVSTTPGLIVFPNPSKDYVLIEFENQLVKDSEISIFDITGRLMHNQQITGNISGKQTVTLNLTTLNNGIYLVKVNSGDQIFQGKILVQH